MARRFAARALGGRLILFVVSGLAGRDGLLDILERQRELVRIELLGTATELHPLQLTQEMLKPIDLRQRLVARRNRRVPFGERRRKPRLEVGAVDRGLIRALAHDPDRTRFARACDQKTAS